MIPSLLAAGGGGLLLSLSFPPARLDLIAWIAFIPLFWALEKAERPFLAALYGAVFGGVFFLIDVRWIYGTLATHGHFSLAPAMLLFVLLVLTLSLFPAVFGFAISAFCKKGWNAAITAPFLWAGSEYLRAIAFTGFPWDLLGYSQVDRPLLIQITDVTGVYGVSFLVVLVNGALWELLRSIAGSRGVPWKLFSSAVLAVILTVSYGWVRLNDFAEFRPERRSFRIGILQGNIAQEIKWNAESREYTLSTYENLGQKVVDQGAELLIWPETAVPYLFGPQDFGWKGPGQVSQKLGVPMLVGAPSNKIVGGASRYYNSAFLLDGFSLRYRYDKMHLVPFGEYMPLSRILPLGPGIASREADYSPGTAMTVMYVNGCPPFSVLICYEAIFPDLARMALKNGARMIINITNDGWFGKSAAPYQHLRMAQVRSVENRVWLLRCANTGVSAAFDPAGRMVARILLNQQGAFVVRVPESAPAGSFYSRTGDVFVWGCLAVILLLAASSIDSLRNRRRGEAQAARVPGTATSLPEQEGKR
jgi:apolipoprotein N-acyltransferase